MGLVHIYCGDGKGKTTCAVGLGVRAFGSGYNVIFCQFLKSSSSGEVDILKNLGISVLRTDKAKKFTFQMNEEEKKEITEVNNQLFKEAISLVKEGKTMLILDEIIGTYSLNLINKEMVLDYLKEKGKEEVVMTGRNPEKELLEFANYVSEIKKIKHPFDEGVQARKGIEY